MAENTGAQREIFITKDQQVAMAMKGDDDASIESKLTKGDIAPPSAVKNNDNISVLTGETRESKAKAYAAEESKKVASQYVGTISNLTSKLERTSNAMAELEAKLERALKALDSKNDQTNKTHNIVISIHL